MYWMPSLNASRKRGRRDERRKELHGVSLSGKSSLPRGMTAPLTPSAQTSFTNKSSMISSLESISVIRSSFAFFHYTQHL